MEKQILIKLSICLTKIAASTQLTLMPVFQHLRDFGEAATAVIRALPQSL